LPTIPAVPILSCHFQTATPKIHVFYLILRLEIGPHMDPVRGQHHNL
jgi:hypothetical protein